jgi:hypothetical protein
MIPSLTSLDVVNRALTEIAQGVPLASGTVGTDFDGSPNGIYAAALYQGAVQMLLRQQDYEFARDVVPLVTGGTSGLPGSPFSYVYPTNAVRIRTLLPNNLNILDPQPVRWSVYFSNGVECVCSNQLSYAAVITTNDVTEGDWDDSFTEAMVRYLGSQLAIPVAGRPDFSEKMLDWAGKVSGSDMDRDS